MEARQIVLVVILLVIGAAFAYDSLVVKPKCNEAWQKVKALEQDGKSKTNTDVHEILGGLKPTSTTNPKYNTVVEEFVWRGGLLFNKHKIFIVYSKSSNDRLYYYSASRGTAPGEDGYPMDTPAINIITDPPPLQGAGG